MTAPFRRLLCTALMASSLQTARAQQAPAAPDLSQMLNAVGAMLGGGTNAAAQVVDFRELKALLPADLGALKRKSASGEKQSNFGLTIAVAEAEYKDEADQRVEIKISDLGGASAMAGAMQYGWASMEVDRETDTGYERTATIGGHKALEKYDTQDKRGETQVMVNKRFLVEVTGHGVPAETIKAALGKVDLAKLAGLQAKPAAPATP